MYLIPKFRTKLCDHKIIPNFYGFLKSILKISQAIAGEVADLDTPVHELLAQAQSLLENNKDTAKRDPGTQQQYQRLRFNTSDLKVRFNNVSM